MNVDRDVDARIDAVVIGASAGGLEALLLMLPKIPARGSVVFFVVVHIPRERPSPLAGLLAARCAAGVVEAQDKQPVIAGTIYVAPPDYHLLIEDRSQIALSTDDAVHFSRPSIDVLFESAVDVYGSRMLGVVLSGANDDGSAGLARIRDAGGVTVIQDPASARFPAMPEAALARSEPHAVLDPDAIGELFRRIVNNRSTLQGRREKEDPLC